MHHDKIELNFDASCQQILGFESEILWELGSSQYAYFSNLALVQTSKNFVTLPCFNVL
jgi:hypothetical protein